MKIFKPPVTTITKALYGGLSLFLLASGIISYYQGASVLVSVILVLTALLPVGILLIPYRTQYSLTEDHLVCKWIFGEKKIPYDYIDEVRSFHLPLKSIRRFGISFIGGRYSSKDAGKFFAMFGGKRDGLMIVSKKEGLYGGKIYLTPDEEKKFLEELRERTNAAFSLDKIV